MADYVWTQTAASLTAAANIGITTLHATVPGTSDTLSLDWNAATNTSGTSYWFDVENFASAILGGNPVGGFPGTSDNVYLGVLPNATVTGVASISGFGNVPVTVTSHSNQTSTNDGAYTVTAGAGDSISIANLNFVGDVYTLGGASETVSPTLLIDSGQVSISGALDAVSDIPLGIVTIGESYGLTPAGAIALENGGTLTVSGSADPVTIDFLDGTDTVTLGANGATTSTNFTLDFTNFQTGDEIVLLGGTGASVGVMTDINGDATVSGSIGTTTFDLIFTPPAGHAYTTSNLFVNDGEITITTSIACFTAGTRIATGRGERAVEELREGDLVVTRNGLQPIRWIGRRHLDLTRHPDPGKAQPVRILRDAFAPGMPARDLRLSPDHAVFWNGVLAHAKLLINGMTVVQDSVESVQYLHVELAEHGVLFSEGLRTETYLDTGNRGMFENAGDALILHPDFPIRALDDACAPMALHGPALAAIRQHLLDRAAALGFGTTRDPDLHLMADGRRIDAVLLQDGRRRFHVPKLAGEIRLCSRSGVPAQLMADSTDTRRLGAFVAALRISTPAGRREVALDDPMLGEGWYPCEPGARWTDGSARIDLPRPCILEVALAGSLPFRHRRRAEVSRAA